MQTVCSLQRLADFAAFFHMHRVERAILWNIYYYPARRCIQQRQLRHRSIYECMTYAQEIINMRFWQYRGITDRGLDDTGSVKDREGLRMCALYGHDCNVLDHCQEI